MRYGTDKTLSFIDMETTGKPNEHAIELCVLQALPSGEERGPWTRRFSPPVEINYYARRVHGISPDELKGCKPFPERAAALHKLLEGTILVAHGAPQCETPVLTREFTRSGLSFPFASVINTVPLAQKVWPGAGIWKLSALVELLKIPRETAHTAQGDTVMLFRLWELIYKRLGPQALVPVQRSL